MNYNLLSNQRVSCENSIIGILLIMILCIIYLALTSLSVIQIFSSIEWNSINTFESTGTKARPYFLNVFTCGLLFRLFYLIIYLIINIAPKLFNNESLKFKFFKIYDYIINIVFLISYLIIIGIWSSISLKSRYERNKNIIPNVIILNLSIYILCIMLLFTLFFKESNELLYRVLYLSKSIIFIICFYSWIYYGYSLIKQIDRRQYINLDLERNSIKCNIFDNYKSTMNFNSDLNKSSLWFNDLYNSIANKLKYKIMLLTIVCPMSFLLSSIHDSLLIFNLGNCNLLNLSEASLTTIYIFLIETIPCLAIIYGFWNDKIPKNITVDTETSFDRLLNNISVRYYTLLI